MTKVEDYNPYRWKEGLICFSDESFPNIMKDFEIYKSCSLQSSITFDETPSVISSSR